MSDPSASRFAPQNKTTQERLSTTTVGLVALSDFRKRRAEVLEQQGREQDALATGTSTPDRSQTATPDVTSGDSGDGAPPSARAVKKSKKKTAKKLLSFDDDGDDGEGTDSSLDAGGALSKKKLKANTSVGIVPKSMTKAALVKEATEREALRKEFISIQTAVKQTEIAIPFVFYDGASTPGGMVRMTKGDFIWLFLDKSRRVGAELGVGEQANAVKAWARVGVDDLMLVRGTIIIPHHYDFYYFLMNKCRGPGGELIFPYSANAPEVAGQQQEEESTDVLSTAASRAAAAKPVTPVELLEGADGDPTETKVVDRRWYEKNKHIYPASTWQEFDAEKDYKSDVRKDAGGNTFFFSK